MKTSKNVLSLIAALAMVASFASPVFASAIPVSGGTYTQTFDSLPASGSATWTDDSTINGWFADRTNTGTTVVASNGGSTGGQLYSFGISSTATDRALGTVGSAAVGSFAYGAYFTNDTGNTVTDVTVAYTGEEWRNATLTSNTIGFDWRINGTSFLNPGPIVSANGIVNPAEPNTPSGWTRVSSLNFTAPTTTGAASAVDGNASQNRQVFSATSLGVTLNPGDVLWIRWDDPDNSGSDYGTAIDDLSVAFTVVPEPTSIILGALGLGCLCVAARASRKKVA